MGTGELYFCALLAPYTQEFNFMSQHKSLQGSSGIVVKRNVLKRFERVDLLKKRGQWKAGDRVQGLRKTKPDV
ncbi:MAG TPA: small basic protein [Opitutaceae bacterium]|nr:small basic protein [Opitutaceae bacterium]